MRARTPRISVVLLAALFFPVRTPAWGQAETEQKAGSKESAAKNSANPAQWRELLKPLDGRISRIEDLIDKAATAGAETRYFKVSLTLLQHYHREIMEMNLAKEPQMQERTAKFLLECAARTEQGLEEAIRHPVDTIRVPEVDLRNLKVRQGSFFAEDRPVLLAGECGWFTPSSLDYLSNMGFTVLGCEVGPNTVLPAEGAPKPENLKPALELLDSAAKHNLKIDLLLSPHYMPGWAYDKWPDLDPENRRHNNPFMPWDVRSAHLREVISTYLGVALPLYKTQPALLDYDLINEAWYRPFSNLGEAALGDFLKSHPAVEPNHARAEYTTEQVTDFINWCAGEALRRDNEHPVYTKVLADAEVLCVDREALGDILTANGMDSYPAFPDPTGVLAADLAWMLMRLDFHRSLTPDKPILDGEYHPCAGAYDMPDGYFRTALWAPALHGKDSMALWVCGRADEVSVDWHANGLEILGHTALDFLRLGAEIHAFQRQRALIGVYDIPSSRGGPALREAYLASLFQDSDVGVLTDKRVHSGALSRYKVLVIPAGVRLAGAVEQRLEDFKKSGGRVVSCRPGAKAKDLWPAIHEAMSQAGLKNYVSANQWGIECRSVMLGNRRLFYLINYNRQPVDAPLQSSWPLTHMLELRTRTRLPSVRVPLEPLEFKLVEAL